MRISRLEVFLKEDTMFLAFSALEADDCHIEEKIFAQLQLHATRKEGDWSLIGGHFLIKLEAESQKILVQEFDNPCGPYGQASILKSFPYHLLSMGFISPAESMRMAVIINQSKPVKKREEAIRPSIASTFSY